MYICMYVCACVHTCVCACVRACIYTYIRGVTVHKIHGSGLIRHSGVTVRCVFDTWGGEILTISLAIVDTRSSSLDAPQQGD